MNWIVLIVLFVVAIYIIKKVAKERASSPTRSPSKNAEPGQAMFPERKQQLANYSAEGLKKEATNENGNYKREQARRHYKKGNNLWAESFGAALVEFEMALQLDPNNPEYQSAVKHARKNIEESPDGDH